MTRFVQANQDQRLLLPPDMREWVPADDMARFILAAVERVPMDQFRVNTRGTGSAQYHPRMMLALLIDCYAHGIFSSRRIERATYYDLRVRFLTADTHPDHDTICAFRRNNGQAFAAAFLQVLQMAKEVGLLKVGAVSVDGTLVKANASKKRNVSHKRALELRAQLKADIAEMLAQAEQADQADNADVDAGRQLPADLAHAKRLERKLDAACARLEQQHQDTQAAARARHAEARARWEQRGRRNGQEPRPPADTPPGTTNKTNMTDADSRLMKKSNGGAYTQAYNAQAAVDADGSMLIVGARVTNATSDINELVADVGAIDRGVGIPDGVLADKGYANGSQVDILQQRGMDVLIPVAPRKPRRYDFRDNPNEPPPHAIKAPKAPWRVAMAAKMATPQAKAQYRRRQQTVEPAFGIIKQAMGLREFHLRGLEKTNIEWQLAALAYNCKRLHNMMTPAH